MERFKAKAVKATELKELNTFAVVFAAKANDGQRLELQRALEFDAQDRELGQDTYCLCTEWGAAHYGGVSSWSLEEDELVIRLDKKAARALKAPGFVVELSLTTARRRSLLKALRRVLS